MSFLLACTIKATILFLLAGIAARVARKRSAAFRHQIWAIAIVCSLLLPLLQLAVPGWHAIRSTAAIHLWRSATATPAPEVASTLRGTSVDAIADTPVANRTAKWILTSWLVGVACLVLRLIIGFYRLSRVSSRARVLLSANQKTTLLVSSDARTMPCTWGLKQPRILLPTDWESWPEERKQMVLAHELAHIHRSDWVIRLVAEGMRALYWFHPLAWMAAAKLSEQAERACDDAVLMSGARADSYASCLLDLVRTAATETHTWTTALGVARNHNLQRRFTAMLDSTLDRRRTTRRSTLVATAIALCFLLPLAALRAPGQDGAHFTGVVLDSNGSALANATVLLTNTTTHVREMTVSDREGRYSFPALPSASYEIAVLKPGFVNYNALHAEGDMAQTVNLSKDPRPEIEESVHAQIVQADEGVTRFRIGGQVAASNLIHQVHPVYPADAKAARVQGSVVLYAAISAAGVPESLQVMNPDIDPDLARAAVEAVNQWRYRPTLLNGDPAAIEVTVTVNFTLAN